MIDQYAKCESPAEVDLMHLLWKANLRFEQQYNVGRYRIDAVTGSETFAQPVPGNQVADIADVCHEILRARSLPIQEPVFNAQVAWEVDGKSWHDEHKDTIRDKWIIDNSDIEQIVRIPAAALLYFRDACLAALAKKFPSFLRFDGFCKSVDERIEEAEHIADEIDEGHYCESVADEFAEGECVQVSGNEIIVGSPVAFLPKRHRLLKYLSKPKLNQWSARIVIR